MESKYQLIRSRVSEEMACFVSGIQSYFYSWQFDSSCSYKDILFKLRTYYVNKIFLSAGLSTAPTGKNFFL